MTKPTDDEILAAVGGGARTHIVAGRASRFDWGQYVYRRLRVLERRGKVVRCPRMTLPGSIYWRKAEGSASPCP